MMENNDTQWVIAVWGGVGWGGVGFGYWHRRPERQIPKAAEVAAKMNNVRNSLIFCAQQTL
jgi:hypothetical protein